LAFDFGFAFALAFFFAAIFSPLNRFEIASAKN
jgi:hypothetical protein